MVTGLEFWAPCDSVAPPIWGYGVRLIRLWGKPSDRSSKPFFEVSRNLKTAKYHCSEAKIDKLTEPSDITDSDTTQGSSHTLNSVSSSTWLGVTFNMKSTSRKM